MISYLLASFKEPSTIARAMEAIINQKNRADAWELLVCAPDEETIEAANRVKDAFQNFDISIFRDEGKGKPAALNLLFSKVRGEILILTDGDVWLDEYATEKLLAKFNSQSFRFQVSGFKSICLVSGHPIPTNPRNTLLGFWAHTLTASADYKRKKLSSSGKYLDASGYLLAIQKHLITKTLDHQNTNETQVVPTNILVDDSYLSHLAHQNGYTITYASDAIVNVKFPTTFSDWLKQKIRSTGGYLQIQSLFPTHSQMRHFWQEALEFFIPLKFIQSPKEFLWLLLLYAARLYLWFRIVIFYKILKGSYASGWPRIESTK